MGLGRKGSLIFGIEPAALGLIFWLPRPPVSGLRGSYMLDLGNPVGIKDDCLDCKYSQARIGAVTLILDGKMIFNGFIARFSAPSGGIMFTNGFEEGNKSISIFARWTLEEIQRGVIHADFEGLKFAQECIVFLF